MGEGLLASALVLAAGGPFLLRRGWQGARAFVVAGWSALGLAAVLALCAHGAWGLATGTTLACACAVTLLALEGLRTPAPAGSRRPERTPPTAPRAPIRVSDLARRAGVFALVAGVDLAASLAFGWGLQRLARLAGIGAADSLMIALLALPLSWTLLASWQLTRTRLADMLTPALAVGLAGALPWLTL